MKNNKHKSPAIDRPANIQRAVDGIGFTFISDATIERWTHALADPHRRERSNVSLFGTMLAAYRRAVGKGAAGRLSEQQIELAALEVAALALNNALEEVLAQRPRGVALINLRTFREVS